MFFNKKVKKTVVLLIAIFFFMASKSQLYAAENSNKIRVGYIDDKGFIEKQTEDNYQGYCVEYLEEISEYTNWEYEFINSSSWAENIEKLEEGEIDIICNVSYLPQREEQFDFSRNSIGIENCLLYSGKNTDIYYEDYASFDKKKIGFVMGSIGIEYFKEYAKRNGFTYEPIEYSTKKLWRNALNNGEVDLIASDEMDIRGDIKIVGTVSANPFFIVVKEGNELMREIDYALGRIKSKSQNFENNLYSKYYGDNSFEKSPTFSREEIYYIKERKNIVIGCTSDKIPFSNYDEKTENIVGIDKDIMELIREKSGLFFTYVPFDKTEEKMEALKEGEVDLVMGMEKTSNFLVDNQFTISDPYLISTLAVVSKTDTNMIGKERVKIAIPSAYQGVPSFDKYFSDDFQVITYDNIFECVEAVYAEKVDFALDNFYVLRYLIQKPIYENLKILPVSSLEEQDVIVALDNNVLISIINKALETIEEEEKNRLVISQITLQAYSMKREDLFYKYRFEISILLIIVAFSIGTILFILHIRKRNSNQIKEKNNQLYVKQYLYELVLAKTQDVIFEWDYSNKSIKFSKNHEKLTGNEEIVSNFPEKIKGTGYTHCEDEVVLDSIFSNHSDMDSGIREIRFRNMEGEFVWYSIDYSRLYDNQGKLHKIVGMISNIENHKKKLLEMQNQAMRDSLTNLYNRRATENLIEEYLQKEENAFGIMIILDIDNFKLINDTLGHAKGDEVLLQMAHILKGFFRNNDIIGRIGGDEYIVFLTNLGERYDVRTRADELLRLIKNTFNETEGMECISCSLGISFYPNTGKKFQELYEGADALLYEAKKLGKNTYVVWKD